MARSTGTHVSWRRRTAPRVTIEHQDHKKRTVKWCQKRPAERRKSSLLVRSQLALLFTGLIIILALSAVLQPMTVVVLKEMLPALMLVLSFYFGRPSRPS